MREIAQLLRNSLKPQRLRFELVAFRLVPQLVGVLVLVVRCHGSAWRRWRVLVGKSPH